MKEVTVPLIDSELDLIVKVKRGAGDSLRFESNSKNSLEAEIQLMEGGSYEFELKQIGGPFENYSLVAAGGIIEPFSRATQFGHIKPGNYVGTLTVDLLRDTTKIGEVAFEIRSYKSSYREDYRHMLSYITEQCAEIVLQHSSPVTQNLTYNYDGDAQTLYQRFAFVRSVIESDEFDESMHRILNMPVNGWQERIESLNTVRGGRMDSSAVREFAKGINRLELPHLHPWRSVGIKSVPVSVPRRKRYETVDTPENRFVLFVLNSLQQFCADIGQRLKKKGSLREAKHATAAVEKLEGWLSHAMFKEVGIPTRIPLNSPVLQRKEGYREILRAWLMFDLAAKLIWKAGDDIYSAGKKDVAKLYEYWVFFKLLDVLSKKFKLKHKSIKELIRETDDGLSLNLIEGQHSAIEGKYERRSRNLNVKFSFNRTFSGRRNYPNGGSWTKQMRPDYTLSLWPVGMSDKEAEEAELITHVHFDAKYKIDKVKQWFESDGNKEEKEETSIGSFKREDLLKMHAYKDAIRRTGGAYVLYPGQESWTRSGFREVIPGLGAFPLKPSMINDGSKHLVEFIDKVIAHMLNRATQRENASYHIYRIHKDEPSSVLNEPIPEFNKEVRLEPADETTVIIGYCKSEVQTNWINSKGLYNARTGTSMGSIELGPKVTGAKYLLLHSKDRLVTSQLYRIEPFRLNHIGPRIYSKSQLLGLNYPNPSCDYYAVFKVSKQNIPPEFNGLEWEVRKLSGYSERQRSGLPFAVTLRELMEAKSY